MTMKRWDGVAYQDLTVGKRWDGVAYVDLTLAKRWDGVAWIDVPLPGGGSPGLTLSTNHTSVDGEEFTCAGPPLFVVVFTSTSVTVVASGGAGAGPTFSWARLSGDSAVIADSPTSATTYFHASVGGNNSKSAVYRCTVTRGVEVKTIDVAVSLSHFKEDC